MPLRDEMAQELADAAAAEARGYFLPDEDERIREIFVRYLTVRAALLETVDSIQVIFDHMDGAEAGSVADDLWRQRLQAFIVGFTAATMLVRSATFIVDLATDKPVVWKKLDEAEPRYGIPTKSYTRIYKNLVSSRRMWRFHESLMFYEVHKQDVAELAADPIVGGLVAILQVEEPFLQYRKRDYLKRKWDYRLHSFKRRHVSGYKKVMFHLLKLSGSAVAELKQPFGVLSKTAPRRMPGQLKRVTREVVETVGAMLRPGDVFVTRHDDAMSNLFLPGFWPHAALYIGSLQERGDLGVAAPPEDGRCMELIRFLEAKKDGVLFRPLEETLRVDAFMVLRPKLAVRELAEALSRAISHEGKLYDFIFDFRKSDRLACTEVVYRSYHGIGPVHFELKRHTGRPCISAEDLIEQALGSGHFEKVIDYGVEENVIRVF
ncbi:hypothetical protein NT6N_21730 [Oceaniferula spumae]|uniref:Permuted papain-like amidase enzyme, YaeF/YiiX, C92 family n=1 Tax=Oceaniferula spumae TaxID=2979115 RepID=A0AAT9FME0_9BACT